MYKSWVLVGVGALAAATLNFAVWPQHHLGILYAIPLAGAALVLPPLGVCVAALLFLALDLVGAVIEKPPIDMATACFAAILMVSYVAWRLAQQRVELRLRTVEAEASRHQLREFMGMVVHDLRSPLTVTGGYSQLLRRRLDGHTSEAVRSAVDGIDGSVHRMRRLVGDLNDATRIGAGKFDVQPAIVDLSSLVQQVVEEHRSAAPKHALDLDVPGRLIGRWDRERISQVLGNLISNAMKYSREGGRIGVVVRCVGANAEISVSDQGPGIATERLAELFRPYSRLDRKGHVDGTGLGLYISKAIVEAHGGSIRVESTPGRGSTFYVALPMVGSVSPAA
jgi:signal transduction histidine kinase